MLADVRVQNALQDYIVITLFVDDKTRLDEPVVITENGKQRKLKTVGDRWSYLQRSEFGANAQPYYIRLTSDGKPVGKPYSYNEDVDKFLDWLTSDH